MMTPDEALRALLLACDGGPEYQDDEAFEAALDALEALEECLSKAGRQMPHGPSVVARLISQGYCN